MQMRNLNKICSQHELPVQNSAYVQISQDQCKFCFQTETQSNQRLISPCGCSGSMKYVHKDCLKKWITTQTDRRQDSSPFKTKQREKYFQCKLCEKQIKFEEEVNYIFQILTVFRWIEFLYYMKKMKYYICISIIGSLALTYYFGRFMFGKSLSFLLKMKQFSLVVLIFISLSILIYDQSLISIKLNSSTLELSFPYFFTK